VRALSVVILVMTAALWGVALLVFRFRDRPEELSRRLPLMSRYRDPMLRPLFRSSSDVLWFAFWPFALGLVLLGIFVVRIGSGV